MLFVVFFVPLLSRCCSGDDHWCRVAVDVYFVECLFCFGVLYVTLMLYQVLLLLLMKKTFLLR